jgi:hypothetical protein
VLVLLAWVRATSVGSAQITLTGLPSPSHGNLDYIGYYFSISKYGDYSTAVFPYTNLFIALPKNAAYSDDPDWQTPLYDQVATATSQGKRVLLLMSDSRHNTQYQEYSWDDILDVVDEFWSSIDLICIHDDDITSTISEQDLQDDIAALRTTFSNHSLADRPIMANFAFGDQGFANPGATDAEGLDIVGITAYLDDDDDFEDTEEAVGVLEDRLDDALASVDGLGKQAFLNMQAFDRSGVFDDIEMLVALQEIYYLAAGVDDNVIGLGIFSYARQGGTLDHSELVYPHQRIAWAAGLSELRPGCTPGYGNCLISEQWRAPDGYVQSKSGQYRLYYQGDGNLVLYNIWTSPWTAVWDSQTSGTTTDYVQMQGDGNLVIYNASGQPVFSSGTADNPGAYLYLEDTGNISIVRTDLWVIWRRGTAGCINCVP